MHAVIEEMSAFRAEFSQVTQGNVANDLGSFWLRKTKKPVLAVLLVQKPGKPFKLYRGRCTGFLTILVDFLLLRCVETLPRGMHG